MMFGCFIKNFNLVCHWSLSSPTWAATYPRPWTTKVGRIQCSQSSLVYHASWASSWCIQFSFALSLTRLSPPPSLAAWKTFSLHMQAWCSVVITFFPSETSSESTSPSFAPWSILISSSWPRSQRQFHSHLCPSNLIIAGSRIFTIFLMQSIAPILNCLICVSYFYRVVSISR